MIIILHKICAQLTALTAQFIFSNFRFIKIIKNCLQHKTFQIFSSMSKWFNWFQINNYCEQQQQQKTKFRCALMKLMDKMFY